MRAGDTGHYDDPRKETQEKSHPEAGICLSAAARAAGSRGHDLSGASGSALAYHLVLRLIGGTGNYDDGEILYRDLNRIELWRDSPEEFCDSLKEICDRPEDAETAVPDAPPSRCEDE